MTQVIFHQLADDSQLAKKVCDITAQAFTQKQKLVVLCGTQKEAEQVDELLWQFPSDRFIPHNLHGEGPAAGTPVEICWSTEQLSRRAVVVNMSKALIQTHKQFQKVIDFVPQAEDAKQAARLRYKQYQQAGCHMQFQSAGQ